MDRIRQDLCFALRVLRRNPIFSAVAVLTLAIGIGANTAVVSLSTALLLRPLPFRDPDRLVWIENPDLGGEGIPGLTGQANLRDWRALNQSFQDLAAYLPSFTERSAFTLTGNAEPIQLRGAYVSGNLLDLLGIRVAMGRAFTAEECQLNGPKSIVLTDAFWRRQYAADPNIIGRPLQISGASWTVVGILPAAFDYGFSAVFRPGHKRVDFVLPYRPHPGYDNFGNMLAVIGRLKPGIGIEHSQAEFDLLNRQLKATHPERGKFGARLLSLSERASGSHRRSFLLLAVAVGAVLLIACANLSNLLLARGASRLPELATRMALGADRGRLIRQMLTESVLLSAAGGALGLPLARAATTIVARTYSFNIPLLETARIDGFALGATALVTVCTGLLFGIVPAMVLSSSENGSVLNDGTRTSSSGPKRLWVRESLVIAEVALTYILLVCAGLLMHSLMRLLDVNPGFQPQNTLAIRIQTYKQFEKQTAFVAYYQNLLSRVQDIPGVDAATLPDKLPLALNDLLKAHRKGEAVRRAEAPAVFAQFVDPHYFRTFGIPLCAGREFDPHDSQFDWQDPKTKVAIVNQKLAASFWPSESALGKSIILESFPNDTAECTIVGVVGDVRESALDQEAGPEVYVFGGGGSDLVLRTKIPPGAMIPLVRATLRQIDPHLAVSEFRPLRSIIDEGLAPRRLICSLLSLFSITALGLAALGIYGVMAYSVCQRTKEFGIRLALGSSRRALFELILRQGARLALLGCVAGIAGSLAATRMIQSLLFDVGPIDPASIGLSTLLSIGVMVLASWFPAYRASTLDPIAALRA